MFACGEFRSGRREGCRRRRCGIAVVLRRLACALLLAFLFASFLSASGRADGSSGPTIAEAEPLAFAQTVEVGREDVPELDVYDLTSGSWTTVAVGGDATTGAWSPDHQTLAYTTFNSHSLTSSLELWKNRSSTLLAHRTQDFRMNDLVWSPDGKWIAWEDNECCDVGVVGVVNVATGATILSGASLGFQSIEGTLSWSPDSQTVVFAGQECDGCEYNLFGLDVSTGAVTQLTTGSNSFGWPNWDPAGGKLFYYDFGNNELCYMPAPEGGTGGSGCYPDIDSPNFAWAPDGDWAALDSAGTLYVNGSQVGGTGDFPFASLSPASWSPDSQFILTAGGILVDASTGDETALDYPLNGAYDITWTTPGYRPAPQTSLPTVPVTNRVGMANPAEPGVCTCAQLLQLAVLPTEVVNAADGWPVAE